MAYAILGLGRSSRAVIEYLESIGERDITLYVPSAEVAEVRRGYPHLQSGDIDAPIHEGVVVRSPGIRPDRDNIVRALANGAMLTQEVELFCKACPAPIYGVTGSDGKTTTATLAAKMLEAEGYTVWLGGNIGVPPLTFLSRVQPHHRVVLELSSFQLMTFAPTLAGGAVTNLTENHLNWHHGMEEYRRAKANSLTHARRRVQNGASFVAPHLSSLTFSTTIPTSNYREEAGRLLHGEQVLCDTRDIRLVGRHNRENILCAAALTGVSGDSVRQVATTFCGVAHRLEYIGCIRGRHCYNSSIDTTPTRTAVTLRAMTLPVTVICGGYDKHLSPAPLTEALLKHARRVVFTGGNGQTLMAHLTSHSAYGGTPQACYVATFQEAVEVACAQTPVGEAVLLSPAAASFDAFSSYEERGESFVRILRTMKSATGG